MMFENEINIVIDLLNNSDMEKAKSFSFELLKKVIIDLECSQEQSDEDKSNIIFIKKVNVRLIQSYLDYHDLLIDGKFEESWSVLQNIIDYAKILNRFDHVFSGLDTEFFIKKAREYEKIYPYVVFLSIGASFNKIICSICNNDVRDSECSHIQGQLYNGQIASRMLSEGKIYEVSVVDKPYDKRCIAFPKGGYGDKWKLPLKRLSMIEGFWTVDFETIEYIKDDNWKHNYDLSFKCYCNSDKTFQNCCWKDVRDNRRYLHINISGVLKIPNLTTHNTPVSDIPMLVIDCV